MPANQRNYVAKLVSADQLVKYQPITDGRMHDSIVTRFVMPLSPLAASDPLDTIRTHQRVYRLYDRTFRADLRCFIVEYREVL